jgi:subtilisin family serine protease
MLNARFLACALILPFVLAVPSKRVSATKTNRPSNYAPDEVIVKLKTGAPQLLVAGQDERLMTISRLAGEQNGDSPAEQLVASISNQRVGQIISERGLDRVFVLKLEPGSDVRAKVSELRASEDVEYAEPNYLVKTGTIIPNDPQFTKQWALFNNGIFIGDYVSTPNADIKAYKAWDITLGGDDVIIALSDTGVDLTHPDLARNIYTNPGEIPLNGVDDDKNGFVDDVHGFNVADQNGDTSDAVGHGTQKAGIIAAEMNNNVGISGVCQSKSCRCGSTSAPVRTYSIQCNCSRRRALICFIRLRGASIINASWSTCWMPIWSPKRLRLRWRTPSRRLTMQESFWFA